MQWTRMWRDGRLRGRLALPAVLAVAVAVVACGGGGRGDAGGANEPPPPPVTSALPDRLAILAGARAEPGMAMSFGSDLVAIAGLSLSWAFGDGTQASTPTPTHVFQRPGRYTVTLTLTDAGGGRREATHTVDVVRCAAPAQRGWCRQWPGPDQAQIVDLRWADAQTAYAVGELGAVLKTTNGGQSWKALDVPLAQTLVQVAVADAQRLWALAADHSTIWRSRDGGASWVQAAAQPPVPRVSELLTSRSGLLVAHNEASPARSSAVSTDGGDSWRAVPRVLQLEDDGTLWACQDTGCLWKSTDSGASFTEEIGPLQSSQPYNIAWGFGGDGYAWHFQGNLAVWRPGLGAAWAPWLLPDRDVDTLFADRSGQWARTSGYDAQLGRWAIQGLWWRPSNAQAWVRPSLPAGVALKDWPLPVSSTTFLDAPLFVDGESLVMPGWITTDAGQSWASLQALQAAAWTADTQLARVERIPGAGLMATMARPGSADGAERHARQHLRSADAGRTWQPLPGDGPPRYTVTGLAMLDAQRGVASTDQADLWLQTDDGGLNWREATGLPAPGRMSALHFPTSARGYAVVGGQLVASLDAGRSWQRAAPALQAIGPALWAQFIDERIGHVSVEVPGECYLPLIFVITGSMPERGRCVQLFRTQDGGANWVPISERWAERPTSEPSGFVFVDARRGVRSKPYLMSTADGGATWQAAPADALTQLDLDEVRFVRQGAQTLWALAGGQLLRSMNAGLTWGSILPPLGLEQPFPMWRYWSRRLRDIQFTDARYGWLVGDEGLLIVTVDGGNSWQSKSLGLKLGLRALVALPEQGIWLAGERGSIFRRRLP